jgi:hypothetical protein
MALVAPVRAKIPTKIAQLALAGSARPLAAVISQVRSSG